MNHNSDFESGPFLDLECSQTFKPTQTLANFLESLETELQVEQTVIDTSENSQSGHQKKCTSTTTESGASLFKKTETDEFFEELEKFISASDDYGDSDTDGTNGNYKRRTTSPDNVGFTNDKTIELGENKYREKSPRFGDFFRINDDYIQSANGYRGSDFLSNYNDSTNDNSYTTETNARNSTSEEMDDLYTGDSDDNERDGNNELSTFNNTTFKVVDESEVENKNICSVSVDSKKFANVCVGLKV
ncbi:hypothetical protein AGLY_013589 [Aphis glycines]|uniref:Uncharacterized protein n=1 Tax=Aphis glycines TaxID=307491 RepID=A0A6G0T6R5_APHGL|nr:hypothetical protein AGLY_013589 [Aphis glycines]